MILCWMVKLLLMLYDAMNLKSGWFDIFNSQNPDVIFPFIVTVSSQILQLRRQLNTVPEFSSLIAVEDLFLQFDHPFLAIFADMLSTSTPTEQRMCLLTSGYLRKLRFLRTDQPSMSVLFRYFSQRSCADLANFCAAFTMFLMVGGATDGL